VALTLVIGNKNYSSWSFRPWIALKVAGIPFEEILVPIGSAEFKERVLKVSGSGKVPALIDGDVQVWESLAILEYLAERFPEANLWPSDRAARAHARAVAAEMHSGFVALRRECAMNMWRPVKARELTAEAQADVSYIDAMWSACRQRFGADGPFLFGAFSAADAMYAPVVSRFHTYAIKLSPPAQAYAEAVKALTAFAEWKAAAVTEPWVLAKDEPDWPTVLKA
jgi:glutathione S-transferase